MATLDRVARGIAVSVPAGLLLVGSAVPLPAGHTPDFGPVGPDKLFHLAGHAWLTAALVRAIDADGHAPGRAAALAVALSVGYGLATERLQDVVPGREFEWPDVAAGFLGSLLGVAVGHRALGRRCRGRRVCVTFSHIGNRRVGYLLVSTTSTDL